VAAALLVACAAVGLCCLVAVDLVSWRRTGPIRRGETVSVGDASGCRRTSPTTWLAAATSAALAAGAALAPGTGGAARWLIVAGAAFATVTGVTGRVTEVGVASDGLVVRRARAPEQRAPWAGLREVRPPRFPLGRWQIRSEGGAISLMPSDLLGGESALAVVVRRSDLAFDRGRWRRASRPGALPSA
jgi:hypothetical protein